MTFKERILEETGSFNIETKLTTAILKPIFKDITNDITEIKEDKKLDKAAQNKKIAKLLGNFVQKVAKPFIDKDQQRSLKSKLDKEIERQT